MDADITWMMQAPLAERWTLVRPNRNGFGGSPSANGEDFEIDARDIAAMIEPGDHLAGYSYGGVVSLLAAAERAGDVRSLTVIEPPAFDVARGDPDVEAFISDMHRILERKDDLDALIAAFGTLVHSDVPSPLPPPIQQGARMLANSRGPWEAKIPLDRLAEAPFPKLVVKGEGHPGLLKVCDVLEETLGAESATVPGAGHSVPLVGQPLNDILEAFWTKAS
jgi:pimeloyl-ACP methyl ester carboxylesterase